MEAAHPPERVEGHDERNAEPGLQLGPRHRRHEEVGMHDVVPPLLAGGEAKDPGREGRHQAEQVLLRDRRRGAGPDMHDAHPVDPVRHVRQQVVVPPGEDVDVVADGGEVPCDLPHVDVLAAAVHPAEKAQR